LIDVTFGAAQTVFKGAKTRSSNKQEAKPLAKRVTIFILNVNAEATISLKKAPASNMKAAQKHPRRLTIVHRPKSSAKQRERAIRCHASMRHTLNLPN
jgi:hypothetical protein